MAHALTLAGNTQVFGGVAILRFTGEFGHAASGVAAMWNAQAGGWGRKPPGEQAKGGGSLVDKTASGSDRGAPPAWLAGSAGGHLHPVGCAPSRLSAPGHAQRGRSGQLQRRDSLAVTGAGQYRRCAKMQIERQLHSLGLQERTQILAPCGDKSQPGIEMPCR